MQEHENQVPTAVGRKIEILAVRQTHFKGSAQSTLSKSPGFQVLSNQRCSGPYSRESVFHPSPGIV